MTVSPSSERLDPTKPARRACVGSRAGLKRYILLRAYTRWTSAPFWIVLMVLAVHEATRSMSVDGSVWTIWSLIPGPESVRTAVAVGFFLIIVPAGFIYPAVMMSWRWRRSRHRVLCPRCWSDLGDRGALIGSIEHECPLCGLAFGRAEYDRAVSAAGAR